MNTMEFNPNRKRFDIRFVTALAVLIIAIGGGIGWWAGKGRAQQPEGAMPAGAIPISPKFIADYDKAVERFKTAQQEITTAQKIVKRAMELSLSDASVPLDKLDDYRLDEAKKWMVPLTEADKAKAKRATDLQQQYNQQLQAGQ